MAGVFFLLIGAFFAAYARTVEIGSWSEPGPGFLPFFAGLVLFVMAAALVVGSFRAPGAVMPSFFPKPDSWKRVLGTFAALGVSALSLEYLGFTLTTFVFVTGLVKFIFPQTWTRALLVGLFAAVGTRLLFIDFLKTQLPLGFLGF